MQFIVRGEIYLQLWHVGRMSHPDFLGGALPVAPSALPGRWGNPYAPGQKTVPVPRALELSEIPGIIRQFREGAENAKAAGFDGVEVHGANGYLLDQFLRDGSNRRTDNYGGNLANRARLPLMVTEAVADVWGAKRWDTGSRRISCSTPCPIPIPGKPLPTWHRNWAG